MVFPFEDLNGKPFGMSTHFFGLNGRKVSGSADWAVRRPRVDLRSIERDSG